MRLSRFLWLCLSLIVAPAARAEVRLPALFGDGMVLQRGLPVPVWGTAAAGEKVAVTLGEHGEHRAVAVAGADGKWLARLEPLAAGGPFALTVAGRNTLTLKNVLVGEVWLCAGQSNMEFRVVQAQNAEEELAAANYPNLRLFTVPRAIAAQPSTALGGQWAECSPATALGFSAVAYYFGRELHQTLGVPVGLIQSTWSGTAGEAWTSRPALEADLFYRTVVANWDRALAEYPAARADYEARLTAWLQEAAFARAVGKPEPDKPPEPSKGPDKPDRPAGLFNGMIAPLMPYALGGVIWYHGEANTKMPGPYRRLLPALISDWRANWGRTNPEQGDFPFLFVQLPNYMKRQEQPSESDWAELRDAQLQALALPRTGMAVAIDLGMERNLHPPNKQEVGHRLAQAALGLVFGYNVVPSGPLYDGMTVEGDKVRLRFKYAQGLGWQGLDAPQGFAIAGQDRRFVWAQARIEGETVVVWSEQVPQPVAVRYAWADNPAVNLCNGAGLPVAPFRTDAWPRLERLRTAQQMASPTASK